LIDPLVGDYHPFILFIGAVFLSAWAGGWKPGLLALALGYLVADFFFLQPRYSLGLDSVQAKVGLGFYVFVGSMAIIQFEMMRRRSAQLAVANDQLKREAVSREKAEAGVRSLANIVESSEDAIISKTLDGVIQTWNAGAVRLFGHASEEAIGKPITLIIPLALRDEESAIVERLHRGERIEHFETIRITKGGRRIDVSLTVSPLRDAEGRIIGASKIVRDITARKRVEDDLNQSRSLLNVASRIGRMGAWAVELPSLKVIWSEELRAIHGLPPDREPGVEEGLNFYAPEHRDTMREVFFACLQNGVPFDVEVQLDNVHSERIWVRVLGEAVRRSNGQIIRVQGAMQEVSDRKRAEDAIRASEERIRQLLDSTVEAIYGIDLKGECTFCNSACMHILGYTDPAELIGRNMHALIHHTRADGTPYPTEECRIYLTLQQGIGTHVDDEVLWRADGTSFPAEYWSSPIRINDQIAGSVVTFWDITERKRTEVALQSTQQRLEHVVASSPAVLYALVGTSIENLRLTWISDNVREVTGYSPEEAYSLTWWHECLHPAERTQVYAKFQQLFDSGHLTDEYRFLHLDQKYAGCARKCGCTTIHRAISRKLSVPYRTSPNASRSRNSTGRRRRWKRSANWPGASPTISTTCSPSSTATASTCSTEWTTQMRCVHRWKRSGMPGSGPRG
jgi:PAS domain S-box-containing protein